MKNISRRQFAHRLFRVLMAGGFAHFTFTDTVLATDSPFLPPICPGGGHSQDFCQPATSESEETDTCPGGRDTEDVCLPELQYSDDCPGEKLPEDVCPPSGDRAEDKCSTGRPEADICTPGILIGGQSPDQCPTQNASTDDCTPSESSQFDVCWSGLPTDDECETDGGRATDECPGGGAARDTCVNGKGDECSIDQQPQGSDQCPTDLGVPDLCGKNTEKSDNCYEGVNIPGGPAGSDQCNGAWGIEIGGGDTCLDGSTLQDVCGGVDDTHDEIDVCLPTAEGEGDTDDLCNPGESKGSEDCCFDGLPSSDKCDDIKGDADECPGGASAVDSCPTGMPPEDECPGGASNVDDCNPIFPGSDEPCELDSCDSGDSCSANTSGGDGCSAEDVCGSDVSCIQNDHEE